MYQCSGPYWSAVLWMRKQTQMKTWSYQRSVYTCRVPRDLIIWCNSLNTGHLCYNNTHTINKYTNHSVNHNTIRSNGLSMFRDIINHNQSFIYILETQLFISYSLSTRQTGIWENNHGFNTRLCLMRTREIKHQGTYSVYFNCSSKTVQ